jgi:hypothetical protein
MNAYDEAYKKIHGDLACHYEIRRRRLADGRETYWFQCDVCGHAPKAVRQSATEVFAQKRIQGIPDFDDELREQFSTAVYFEVENIRAKRGQKQMQEQDRWWEKYNRYLETPAWRMKRTKVFERDDYLCQACRHARATQVHHLTYDHAFNEPLFDLISVCDTCHNFITRIDRERRSPLTRP